MIDYIDNPKMQVKFNRSCLNQDKVTFSLCALLNFYIIYKINLQQYYVDVDFTLANSLFWAFKLAKDSKSDKYSYSVYSVGFDARGDFNCQRVVGQVKM